MNAKRLRGKRAVITGGSDGIGRAIATAFASEGADVWLVGRDNNKLHDAAEEIAQLGVAVHTTAADLTDPSALNDLARDVIATWTGLHVLVNNAGMARFTPFADVSADEMHAQLQLNLVVPFQLTQHLLSGLTAVSGSVINISSTSAHRLIPGRPASVYAMTKGGINSLTKALALELGPVGVRVNAIAPGTVKTSLTQNLLESFTPERRAEYDRFVKQSFALGRLGEPEDVGYLATYLASDEARWTTGSVFVLDGGLSTN